VDASANSFFLYAGSTHARATTRAPFRGPIFVSNASTMIERDAIDEALVDQERFQRFDPQREIGGNGLLIEILARLPKPRRRSGHDPGGTARRRLEKASPSNGVLRLGHRTPAKARIRETLPQATPADPPLNAPHHADGVIGSVMAVQPPRSNRQNSTRPVAS